MAASTSAGTFTDGPFGIGSGAILTTGQVVNANPGRTPFNGNLGPGSPFCGGTDSFSAAILTVDVVTLPGFDGILFEFILASQELG
jgi:hypothetical protein